MVTTCSAETLLSGEQLAGTAPTARSWIVVEHPGPWGRDAVADSPLPDAVRRALGEAKAHGIGVLLARHLDRLDRAPEDGHHVWWSCSRAGGLRLRHAVLDDLAPVARWDMEALARGEAPAFGSRATEPLLLVCTHGRRDQCCAVNGRALVQALLATATDDQRARVWECSHVGGHRFSAVTLTLPGGVVHGRLSPADAPRILAHLDAGAVHPEHLRGRSCFPAPLQAADVAVRQQVGVDGVDDLDVLVLAGKRAIPVDLGWPVPTGPVTVEVRHRDGRAWHVRVQHEELPQRRPESCGTEPVAVHSWVASSVTPAPEWQR